MCLTWNFICWFTTILQCFCKSLSVYYFVIRSTMLLTLFNVSSSVVAIFPFPISSYNSCFPLFSVWLWVMNQSFCKLVSFKFLRWFDTCLLICRNIGTSTGTGTLFSKSKTNREELYMSKTSKGDTYLYRLFNALIFL